MVGEVLDSANAKAASLAGSDLAASLSGRKYFTQGLKASGLEADTIYGQASRANLMFSVNGEDSTLQLNQSTATDGYLQLGNGTINQTYFTIQTKEASTGTVLGSNIFEGSGAGTANNRAWFVGYNASANYFRINSGDTDGATTAADVVRIPDGQLTVDGNSTFDDNAFDYVCPTCYRHFLEPGLCPDDHAQLKWQDDVSMLREAIRNFGKGKGPVVLEKIGVLKTDENGQRFISMNKSPWVAFSAIVQQSDRITMENAGLQKQIDDLKQDQQDAPVWPVWLGAVLICGLIVAMRRKGLIVGLLVVAFVGSAYAWTLNEQVLIAFKRGNGRIASTAVVLDSLRVAGMSDTLYTQADTVRFDNQVQDAIRDLETERLIVQRNNNIRLTRAGIDSVALLPSSF